MTNLIILLSIVLAVFIGYKKKINVGAICIAFAYILGCFVLDLKAKEVIAMWPTSLFFFIMASSFFYGIAVTNGTLGLFAEHAIYITRNRPALIPIMMWIACFALSALGPGPTTIFAFMPAIVLAIADRIKMNKLVAAIIIVGGGVAGGYSPISLCYVTVKNCIINAGFEETAAAALTNRVSINVILAQVIIFIIVYLLCKTWKVKSPENMERPAAFTSKQKQTLAVIVIGLAIMVLFPLMHVIAPKAALITKINSKLEPSLFFTVLLVISLLLNLGDQKAAMNFVPWGTILLISGTGMLVAVATKAGAIDYLSAWLGNNMGALATKIIVGLISGAMSFFSSTLGVVAPTLIPIISGISETTGVAVTALVSAIMVGGHFAGVSPFSTGGAMVLAGEKDEEKKNALFLQLMALSIGSIVLSSILTVLGILS